MRTSDPFRDLTGDRRTIRVDYNDPSVASRLKNANAADSFYGHMFAEDLSRLFPYGRGVDSGFGARIASNANDVEAMLLNALPVQYRPPDFLADGLREFAADIAREMVSGPILLEIELFRGPTGDRARAFDIHVLPNGLFGYRRGNPIQWIGRDTTTAQRRPRFVVLNGARVVRIDLPSKFRRDLNNATALIREADAIQGVAVDMITTPKTAAFDFSAHQRLVGEVALHRTRAVGWDGRGLFVDDALEPYRVWRRLRFARFQLHVRDAVIEGINRVLGVVGDELGFVANVEIEHVLTAAHLDRAEASLQSGEAPVSALMRLEPDDILPPAEWAQS